MTISLFDAGKRFNREWIFRHFVYEFEAGQSYAIIGPNGSGKSTLLQVLSGSMMLNEGRIQYSERSRMQAMKTTGNNPQPSTVYQPSSIPADKAYEYVSVCAPYLELVEEMTLKELLDFHRSFKPFSEGITTGKIISLLGLENAARKQIRYYSSGMKQRVKLAQCIFSDTPVVLLDEPCTNLDAPGIELYRQLIAEYCTDRLVVVSSNDKMEYSFCKQVINIASYK